MTSGFRVLLLAVALVSVGACSENGIDLLPIGTSSELDCSQSRPTAEGAIAGVASRSGKTCAYMGVRYAAAPVGSLRFAPPQPPPKFTGTKVANTFGDMCIQKTGIDQMGVSYDLPTWGAEDCLFLNIWRPQGEKLPVMVFFHGGAFVLGAGSWSMYEGDNLAQEGVIVVTVNYRLGPMGFLAYPSLLTEAGTAGNQGILDQIQALTWVRDNIANFGGDPGNVTIFGESAGGMSVCTLLASPKAKGLFHAGIIESGGCKAVAELPTGYAHAVSYAADVGCAGASDIVKCMRDVPAEDFITDAKFDVVMNALEPHLDGSVLEKTPLEYLRSGAYNDVPVLAGTNANEIQIVSLTNPNNDRLKTVSWLKYYGGLEALYGVTETTTLKKYYGESSFANPFDAWFMLKTDYILACPTLLGAQAAGSQGAPAYHYIFSWDNPGITGRATGTMHGLELFFVFGTLSVLEPLIPEADRPDAETLSATVRKVWANFARSHRPFAEGIPEWATVDQGSMILDLESKFDGAIKREECAYWDPRLPMGLENQASDLNALVENIQF